MRYFIIIIIIGLALGWFYYGGEGKLSRNEAVFQNNEQPAQRLTEDKGAESQLSNPKEVNGGENQPSRSEAVFQKYGQQLHQRFEEIKLQTNFEVIEPGVVPAGFYFNGFEPQGSLAEDKDILTFRYYKHEGKRYFGVLERPVKTGETLGAPDETGWEVVEKAQLKNGAPAYYLKQTKIEGGPVQSPVKGQQIKVEFITYTAELRLIVGKVYVRLISTSGGVGFGGAEIAESVLSKADLLKVANSLPGL